MKGWNDGTIREDREEESMYPLHMFLSKKGQVQGVNQFCQQSGVAEVRAAMTP